MTKKISWPVLLYIGGYHLFLCIALPFYFASHSPSSTLLWITAALVFISGMSITAGYHRMYSHSCYKLHPIVEGILLFFGSLATQGSALRWSHDHRLHHAHIDTDKDPYSVKKGLFHAHVLWMFFRTEKIDPKIVSDLMKRKILVLQHKYYVFFMLGANVISFLAVGWLIQDYWSAFLFAWWVRLFFLHHTTWCINSLAHYWGSQNYSQEHSAVDNYLISLLTYGEGYHNDYHTFAYDYRNGIRWYHFDPSKWLVWTLSRFGLATDVKRVNNYRITRQMVLQHKDQLLAQLKESIYIQKVTEIAEKLSKRLSDLQTMMDKEQIKSLKRGLKNDWKEWKAVLKLVRNRQLVS